MLSSGKPIPTSGKNKRNRIIFQLYNLIAQRPSLLLGCRQHCQKPNHSGKRQRRFYHHLVKSRVMLSCLMSPSSFLHFHHRFCGLVVSGHFQTWFVKFTTCHVAFLCVKSKCTDLTDKISQLGHFLTSNCKATLRRRFFVTHTKTKCNALKKCSLHLRHSKGAAGNSRHTPNFMISPFYYILCQMLFLTSATPLHYPPGPF